MINKRKKGRPNPITLSSNNTFVAFKENVFTFIILKTSVRLEFSIFKTKICPFIIRPTHWGYILIELKYKVTYISKYNN